MITPKFKIWIKAAVVRAVRTTAQTIIAMIPVGVTIEDVSWGIVASTALLAGILSIMTSLAGLPEVEAEEEARKLEEVRRLNGQD